jgi:hypothetical protein
VATALLAAASPAEASATRPEPGHTGGFGEPTCRSCHFDGPLDASGGSLRLEGLPATARSGSTYRLSVVLERDGLARGGFQLAARFADGALRGRSAGLLRPVDGTVEVIRADDASIDFAHHSPTGTRAATPGELRWTLDWIAPDDGGRVLFHAAANAANDDDSELGDLVYATEAAAEVGATRLALRVDPLAELYFATRAAAAEAPASTEEGAAVAAARRVQTALGAFGGWGPLDAQVFTASDPAALLAGFEALPETMRRRGSEIAIRTDAIAWARALEAGWPEFVARRWPARRAELAALVVGLERDFLPAHGRALRFMMDSLGIRDPAVEVPVVLVTACHPPGASTYYLDDGSPASVVGAPALAARGQLAETILHEATHGLDIASGETGSAFATLRDLLAQRGLGPRDRLFHDIPHALMFVQAAETMRRVYDPEHVPYGESSGVYARFGRVAEVERRIWPLHLDAEIERDEALRRIVDELVPPVAAPAE